MGSSVAGELSTFQVGDKKYPIFTSGDLSSTKCISFIPGLWAGLGSIPYHQTLSEGLKRIGWKLVQFHWSGAYDGFGTGSLYEDAKEMDLLVEHLEAQGTTELVWMGNSTGCQDTIHYLTTVNPISSIVKAGILQAPVSDRETWTKNDKLKTIYADGLEFQKAIPKAKEMIDAGRGNELCPDDLGRRLGGRLTWYRLFSLIAVGGDDDYFSSDLPLDESSNEEGHAHPLSTSFGKLPVPTLCLWSGKDEYAWSPKSKRREEILDEWKAACPDKAPMKWKVLTDADHEVTDEEAQKEMVSEVLAFISKL